jgi:hypothetical protein
VKDPGRGPAARGGLLARHDTALSTGAATLPALLAFAQPGDVVFGSDWPFAPQTVVNHFTDGLGRYPGLDDASRWAVYRDNAVALLS